MAERCCHSGTLDVLTVELISVAADNRRQPRHKTAKKQTSASGCRKSWSSTSNFDDPCDSGG